MGTQTPNNPYIEKGEPLSVRSVSVLVARFGEKAVFGSRCAWEQIHCVSVVRFGGKTVFGSRVLVGGKPQHLVARFDNPYNKREKAFCVIPGTRYVTTVFRWLASVRQAPCGSRSPGGWVLCQLYFEVYILVARFRRKL